MKKTILSLTLAAIAAVYAAPASKSVSIDTPFIVRGIEMPAGRYTITANDAGVMTLKGDNGKSVSFVTVRTGPSSSERPWAKMKTVGGKQVLTEISMGYGSQGYWVPAE
jgi:hypothetical protein